jgi:hypothetical protein
MEVRENVLFRFENDDSDWFDYDDKYLWWSTDDNDQDIYLDEKIENLEVRIDFDIIKGDDTLSERLDKKVVTSSFFLKCIKLIEQEFELDQKNYSDHDYDQIEITINDPKKEKKVLDEDLGDEDEYYEEKIKFKKMKYVKTFESFDNSEEIKKYLEDNYSEEWFNEQLDERAPDYVDSDWEEDGYESEADWYMNHACGGAIEYDLLGEISKDVQRTFGLTYDQAEPYVSEIFNQNCHWKDSFCFGEKSVRSPFDDDYNDLKSKFDNLPDSFKSADGRDIKL